MLPIALQGAANPAEFLVTFWPALVLSFFLFVAFLYIVAYLNRFFEYLKAQESRYLDLTTLGFVKWVIVGIWVYLAFLLALVAFASGSPQVHDALELLVLHTPSILFVTLVLTAAVMSARAVGRFLSYMRGQLEEKPEKVLPRRSLVVTEMVAKYAITILGVVIAILGGIGLLPPQVPQVQDFINETIFAPLSPYLDPRYGTSVLVILVTMAIAARLADSVFTDFKLRTRKWNPRVVDLFRSVARYSIIGGAALAILFLTLSVSLAADQLVLIGLILVVAAFGSILLVYDPVSNALSGIALINADPFQEGDRIKIGDELVCDVLEANLTVTKVRSLRGEVITIPNKELLAEAIMNFSRSKPYAMTVDITVSFDRPHRKVESLLVESARRVEGILEDPAPTVYAKEIHGNAMSYQLWAYIADPQQMKRIRSELISKAQELFHEEDIKLLFLQV